MPRYRVAHVREQGHNMIIVPLDASFGERPPDEQQALVGELQMRSNAAGMGGRVVPVWPGGFLAPPPWHPFFRSLSIQRAAQSCNKVLSW